MDAVEIVNNVAEARDQHQPLARRIVLVSDMQEGSRLTRARRLSLARRCRARAPAGHVRRKKQTPACITSPIPIAPNPPLAEREIRVRVSNDADSTADEFQLAWLDQANKPIGDSTPAYVPAGESRIVRVPRPANPAAATRLRLTGDNHDFDNTIYLAARPDAATSVLYLGDDRADDAKGLRYYLGTRPHGRHFARRYTCNGRRRQTARRSNRPPRRRSPLSQREPTADQTEQLRNYADSRRQRPRRVKESQDAAALAKLVGVPSLDVEEAKLGNYAMLGQIDFAHPLFAPMAGPHFNDFTQIHFWKYRRLKADQLKDAKLVARFENGDPALVEWTIGKGRVIRSHQRLATERQPVRPIVEIRALRFRAAK